MVAAPHSGLNDYNDNRFRRLLKRYDMRILQIVGVFLIAGGLFVLIKAPSYSSEKSVLKIGDVEAKVAQEHPVPPWAGGAAIAAGVVLIVVGARKS
jgi:drug/metabolite transporter (DMT)-like permease